MDVVLRVSIVIPIYNEIKTIEKIIDLVEKANIFGLEKEIILVDDGSNDGTREKLKKYEDKHKVIYNTRNFGKGFSLRQGFKEAVGDVVIIQDADLEYNPDEYEFLIRPIIENKADVVYGSRFLGGGPHRVLYFWHFVGNKFLTTLSNMFTNLNLTDMETCSKVFRAEIIKEILPGLKSDRFGFEPEITAKVAKLSKKRNCRIYEVGISYDGRTYEEGKKISWRDGIEAIFCIIKFNLFG